VQFFDFFGTEIKALPDGFFGPWASNILRLPFWNTPIQMLGTVGLEKLESIEMAYFHENRCDGGAPHYGPSFDNFAEVSDILTGINPLVTFTMEAMEEMQDSTMRALVQQIPIAVRIIVMESARTSRPPFPILQGKSEFLKLCFRGIWVVLIWFCGCFFFVLD
jgi:hypothetical protein